MRADPEFLARLEQRREDALRIGLELLGNLNSRIAGQRQAD